MPLEDLYKNLTTEQRRFILLWESHGGESLAEMADNGYTLIPCACGDQWCTGWTWDQVHPIWSKK